MTRLGTESRPSSAYRPRTERLNGGAVPPKRLGDAVATEIETAKATPFFAGFGYKADLRQGPRTRYLRRTRCFDKSWNFVRIRMKRCYDKSRLEGHGWFVTAPHLVVGNRPPNVGHLWLSQRTRKNNTSYTTLPVKTHPASGAAVMSDKKTGGGAFGTRTTGSADSTATAG